MGGNLVAVAAAVEDAEVSPVVVVGHAEQWCEWMRGVKRGRSGECVL